MGRKGEGWVRLAAVTAAGMILTASARAQAKWVGRYEVRIGMESAEGTTWIDIRAFDFGWRCSTLSHVEFRETYERQPAADPPVTREWNQDNSSSLFLRPSVSMGFEKDLAGRVRQAQIALAENCSKQDERGNALIASIHWDCSLKDGLPEETWQPKEVICRLSGSSIPSGDPDTDRLNGLAKRKLKAVVTLKDKSAEALRSQAPQIDGSI